MRSAVQGDNSTTFIDLPTARLVEMQRTGLTGDGVDVPRPLERSGSLGNPDAAGTAGAAVRKRLLADVPADGSGRTPEEWSRWRLAHLLDWHRREAKATCGGISLVDMMEEDLFDEPTRLPGRVCQRVEVVSKKTGKPTGSVIDRYRDPPQEMEIGAAIDVSRQAGPSSVTSCR